MKVLVRSRQSDVAWKSEFAKECVTTHRPKAIALKMMTLRVWAYTGPLRQSFPRGVYAAVSKEGRGGVR
ncbi:hypothetical protein JTE90_015048 [Oedothorax gibbosus]|uniref:Uncharacterized protein n=1 Tax=Oedothorax gibbosus TaxID=931172 RepID=A0AAV6TN40_9ARAC|nr:hypothetical protein JTE90_015048 [Oedothorax gibbosus]